MVDKTTRMIENIIPILQVKDLAASLAYYNTRLGFATDWSAEGFAGIARDGWRLYLSTDSEASSTSLLWVGVEDLDALYRDCQAAGAKIKSGIVSNEWAREFLVEDLDGHVLRFGGEPEA